MHAAGGWGYQWAFFLPLSAVIFIPIHTHTPAKKSSANFRLYPFLLQTCFTNCLGHGHGYECHSPLLLQSSNLHVSHFSQRSFCGARSSCRPRFFTCLHLFDVTTPSPPTKSVPTKSPRVELSGRLPVRLYGHENSHPLELRVCIFLSP